MKLRSITLTTGIFPPDIGGPASFISIFANELSKRGIDVTVITLSDDSHDDSHLPYKVIRINRKTKKPFRDIIVIKEIIKAATKSDLIFSNTLAFESAIAAKLSKKPFIQKIVGDIAWERANTSGRFKGNLEEYQKAHLDITSQLTNFYRNFAVKTSDLIITPSYYLKNIINMWDYPHEKVAVIYNAVEFEEADAKIPKEKFRILSVARLIPHKGIEAILRCLTKLDFEFEYVIIGDGPLKSELELLSHTLRVNTKFLGNISKKDVATWLANSDLFILNSSYEGLPHIVLEAMENGCPVIASNVGGTPEVLKDFVNGLLYEHNNIDELFDKINIIKNDEVLREKLVLNGKKFTEQFADVHEMVSAYMKIFQRIING